MTRKTFLIFFLFFSLTLVYSQKSIGSIDRLDSEINNLISIGAKIEILAEGFTLEDE